jgi:hypothetical protein
VASEITSLNSECQVQRFRTSQILNICARSSNIFSGSLDLLDLIIPIDSPFQHYPSVSNRRCYAKFWQQLRPFIFCKSMLSSILMLVVASSKRHKLHLPSMRRYKWQLVRKPRIFQLRQIANLADAFTVLSADLGLTNNVNRAAMLPMFNQPDLGRIIRMLLLSINMRITS